MAARFQTIIEPFRIKMIEPIPMLTREERLEALEKARHNIFLIPARLVTIDLLTDSGTGAMSAQQWGAMMIGDESYANSTSFERFSTTMSELTGYNKIFPVHQGRAAEKILMTCLLQEGDQVLSNTHFDTTRGNIEFVGGNAIDIPIPEGNQPEVDFPFKGNMDISMLKQKLENEAIKLVIMTVTNNAVGGQPVSMRNIREASGLCKQHNVPYFLDSARFAENCWFIHTREDGYQNKTLYEIAQEMFRLTDGCIFSAKKDAIVNIGGILATSLEWLEERLQNMLILTEGFPSYGGLAGRDIEAMTTGILEALDPEYLRYRHSTIEYLSNGLLKAGIPIVQPAGGHAVYIDAGRMLSHIPSEQFPGVALVNSLYVEGGIRGVEMGRLMFPKGQMDLVRLALPRRVYTQAHIDYVIEVLEYVHSITDNLKGLKITKEPQHVRHFTAELEPIE